MEPLGIIVFSCIMGTAGFSVILEAVRQLLAHTKTVLPYERAVVGAPRHATLHACMQACRDSVSCQHAAVSIIQIFRLALAFAPCVHRLCEALLSG